MSIATQNWDGVTPPALPAGWTVSSSMATTAAVTGITPTSSPNMLGTTASTLGWATYGTLDGNSGDVIVAANFNISNIDSSKKGIGGLTARASSTTLDVSTTSWYAAYLDLAGGTAVIEQYVSGTQTTLGTLYPSILAYDVWYTLSFTVTGVDLSLQIVRSDGYYLTSSGTWASGTPSACLTATSSAISGQGYSGLLMDCNYGNLYTDDWSLSAASAPPPAVYPRPLVVTVPFGYYPAISE